MRSSHAISDVYDLITALCISGFQNYKKIFAVKSSRNKAHLKFKERSAKDFMRGILIVVYTFFLIFFKN